MRPRWLQMSFRGLPWLLVSKSDRLKQRYTVLSESVSKLGSILAMLLQLGKFDLLAFLLDLL